MNNKTQVELLSVFWGENHLQLWKRACLTSLGFKRNKAMLHELGAKINIVTNEKFFPVVEKLMFAQLPEMKFELRAIESHRDYTNEIQSALVWQMGESVKNQTKIIIAPPDTIFGDGTIQGLWKLAQEPFTCVAVPHPRVLPDVLDQILYSVPNSDLVRMAFDNLHDSWTKARHGVDLQTSYQGGVWWDELSDGTYSVTHRLPTVYLIHPIMEDYNYFKSCPDFGHFDHVWPSILLQQQRQRMCTSSDVAFIVEVTEKDKNLPRFFYNTPQTEFWQSHFHNQMNRQYPMIFRATPTMDENPQKTTAP